MCVEDRKNRVIVIVKEALSNSLFCMESLFLLNIQMETVVKISNRELWEIVREILCSEFNIFLPLEYEVELKHAVFHGMFDEQSGILNFHTEQRNTVVNGAVGTGVGRRPIRDMAFMLKCRT